MQLLSFYCLFSLCVCVRWIPILVVGWLIEWWFVCSSLFRFRRAFLWGAIFIRTHCLFVIVSLYFVRSLPYRVVFHFWFFFSSVFWYLLFLSCVCRFFFHSFARYSLLITFECVISSDDAIIYLFYCMPRGLRIRSRYVYKQSWIHYCGIIRTIWNKRKEKRRKRIERKKCSSQNQFNRHIHSQIC